MYNESNSSDGFYTSKIFSKGLEAESAAIEHTPFADILEKAQATEKTLAENPIDPEALSVFCHARVDLSIKVFDKVFGETQPSNADKDYSAGIAETYLGAAKSYKRMAEFFDELVSNNKGFELPKKPKTPIQQSDIRFLIDSLKGIEGNGHIATVTESVKQLEKVIDRLNELKPVNENAPD